MPDFFVVLSAPEVKGDLVLFPLEWSTYQVKSNLMPETVRKDHQLFFENHTMKTEKITLQTGDLVVFRAAQIWHYIIPLKAINRITVGGFVAKAKDGPGTLRGLKINSV